MATFQAATASNRPEIDADQIDELNKVISHFDFSGAHESLTVLAHEDEASDGKAVLELHGYAHFQPQKIKESYIDREPDLEDESTYEFLESIAPFLEEKLVIQTIGREKCRFPFLASVYAVWPDGHIEHTTLDSNPERQTSRANEAD
ncbi:hypothetical protein SAMN05216388_102634 [Halorientalis persicus]|uniref:Uncharacterized protein n=1 Tax=Halorientalis persicus TaxID=1367881 RepID=A0A1H8U976_9EURY|nr:hypothetical protein SAMN05216388_102634 [Halorientalis persicus]